jgi:hypothetical protein
MEKLTPEGLRILDDVARRHGVSFDAVVAVLVALVHGRGRQAQFDHQELGGMGQWSQGGMTMVGDMFNQSLKYRVEMLCSEIADLLHDQALFGADARPLQSQNQIDGGVSLFVTGSGQGGRWWPVELGKPASVGSQNDLRYACFPDARRLAIQRDGRVVVYDTGEHRIEGFSQQQGGDQSLSFTSQFGLVRVTDLPLILPSARHPPGSSTVSVTPQRKSRPLPAEGATPSQPAVAGPALATDDILSTIERLAELRHNNILTEEEFKAKKAELLSRL